MATATKEGLKRMVMQFRLADLQNLLEFAGEKNRKGRKKELQKKALNLISMNSTRRTASLQNKIYRIYQNLAVKDDSSERDTSYFPSYQEKIRTLRKEFMTKWPYSKSNYNEVYDSSDSDENNPARFALVRNNYLKYDVEKLPQKKFKTLSFFEYISIILPLTPLTPLRQDSDVFECVMKFVLPDDVHNALNSCNSDESPYQVQIRICVLDDQIEVSDTLPSSLSIKVNDNYCTLPPPIASTNRQGMLLKRMNTPINITSEVYDNKIVNNLVVTWSTECEELYGLTVHFVRKYSADELINKLKEKGERDPSLTKKTIYDNLNDEDAEIAATSLKMSLVCPLGKILISLPTRATTCNHLQCFDGMLYIKMNDVKSTWQCPVCNQSCLYEDLYVDGYFSDVLRNEAFVSSCTEIELDADGNWTPVQSRKRKLSDSISPICKKPSEKIPEVEITSDNPSNDLASDLQNFYYQYNKDSEMHNYRSSFPILPSFHEINNHYLNVKAVEEPELSIISEEIRPKSPKKNVMLVDLTISDSDTDDICSLSEDDSYNSYSPIVSPPCAPPVYDISDSDSEGLCF